MEKELLKVSKIDEIKQQLSAKTIENESLLAELKEAQELVQTK